MPIGQSVQPESQVFSKIDSSRPTASFSPFEEQSRQTYDESRDSGIATNLMNLSLRGSVDQMFNSSNSQPEPVYNGFAASKGSRFAKFFDGKARDTQSQSNKSQVPAVGYISPSPNHHQRQEQSNLSNLASNPGDQRTMDDIFAMLNSSSQVGIGLWRPYPYLHILLAAWKYSPSSSYRSSLIQQWFWCTWTKFAYTPTTTPSSATATATATATA